MNGDIHVRFWEGERVRFPLATHLVLARGTVCFVCTKQADVQYFAIERASFAFTFPRALAGLRRA
jgi:hypothetical protein